MIHHLILIASSYELGKRIAWHYADEEISQDTLLELNEKTSSILGSPMYVVHKLSTTSKSWDSVVKKDSFFEDIEVILELEKFLKILSQAKKISALDIGKFLLSLSPMSNLKLQKMIYLTYADYLTTTGKTLFEEPIITMQYGPLIEQVYQEYKKHGRNIIETSDSEITLESIKIPLALSKILQADDAESILSSIKKTFEEYGRLTAAQLVDITHRENSPWSINYHTRGMRAIITDSIIKQHHQVEKFIST